MRIALILPLLWLVSACSPKNDSKTLELEPGDRGTFVALGAETELDIKEPAKEGEEGFRFTVKTVPGKGISIGRAVGNHQADDNDSKFFVPASITKVVTTGVAFKLLGEDFRFTTRVSWTSQDDGHVAHHLTVFADGDPFSSKERLKSIAEQLKSRGVQRLSGTLNFVSSDPRKDYSFPPFGMDADDYLNCYGSRVQAFNLQRNCAAVQILGWNQARWLDAGIRAPITFQSPVGNVSGFRIAMGLNQKSGFLTGYTVNSVNEGKRVDLGLAVPNVKAWYANSFYAELQRAGIDASSVQLALNPSAEIESGNDQSFEIRSSPLSDIVRTMNKISDNWLAEALYKAAAGFDKDANIQSAAINTVKARVREWMKETPDLAKEISLYDGAGLSRANQVTPRAFLSLLKAFTKEKFFPKLWTSLPIAGVDGTLRGRMSGSLAAGTVRAKTGTLKGCYQLAGYIPRLNDKGDIIEYVPFVILSATTPSQSSGARGFQDRLLGELAAQINKGKTLKRDETEAIVVKTPKRQTAVKKPRKK